MLRPPCHDRPGATDHRATTALLLGVLTWRHSVPHDGLRPARVLGQGEGGLPPRPAGRQAISRPPLAHPKDDF